MEIMKIMNITKIYDELTEQPIISLKNISLTINKKDFICIMGASGSGKSTFINCISTIDTPTAGNVEIFNKSILDMSEDEIGNLRNKRIGFIFQDYQLLECLTIKENIAFPLTMMKDDLKIINNKIERQAEMLGIKDILYKYPHECSGGQKQRTAIARALITDPQIIIADELTGNLDSSNTKEVLRILNDLNREEKTIIMVTHDPLVASYSTRMLYLQDGMIKEEIYRKDFNNQKNYFDEIVRINSSELESMIE